MKITFEFDTNEIKDSNLKDTLVTLIAEAIKTEPTTITAPVKETTTKTKKAASETTTKAAEAPVEIPVPETTTETVVSSTETTMAGQVEMPITMIEIRTKLAELTKAGKQQQVKELINSFGAAKLTDVDPAKYTEMYEKAGKL